jgi:hypothetical protein
LAHDFEAMRFDPVVRQEKREMAGSLDGADESSEAVLEFAHDDAWMFDAGGLMIKRGVD